MKLFKPVLFAALFAAACSHEVDTRIDTLFINTGHPDSLQSQAIARLYEHYVNSDKSKPYYEIVSGKNAGDFILNYNPERKLLTTCTDPGSGWGGQVKNVDEAALLRMARSKVNLNGLAAFVLQDSVVAHNRPIEDVQTNGKPN